MMRNKLAGALLSGAAMLALSLPCAAERGYEGYLDTLAEAPWFDGVRSTIDYQPTTVGGNTTAAWSGIDDNGENMKWIQGGWCKRKDADPKVYWEFTDKDGSYEIGYDGDAPAAAETYEQSRNGQNVEWKRGDTVYKTAAWSKFSTIEFRKAVFTAEMIDPPADHTPGKLASKNKFAASAERRGGDFANAALATQSLPTAAHGNVEKYGDEGSGNLKTWDDRND